MGGVGFSLAGQIVDEGHIGWVDGVEGERELAALSRAHAPPGGPAVAVCRNHELERRPVIDAQLLAAAEAGAGEGQLDQLDDETTPAPEDVQCDGKPELEPLMSSAFRPRVIPSAMHSGRCRATQVLVTNSRP